MFPYPAEFFIPAETVELGVYTCEDFCPFVSLA